MLFCVNGTARSLNEETNGYQWAKLNRVGTRQEVECAVQNFFSRHTVDQQDQYTESHFVVRTRLANEGEVNTYITALEQEIMALTTNTDSIDEALVLQKKEQLGIAIEYRSRLLRSSSMTSMASVTN